MATNNNQAEIKRLAALADATVAERTQLEKSLDGLRVRAFVDSDVSALVELLAAKARIDILADVVNAYSVAEARLRHAGGE